MRETFDRFTDLEEFVCMGYAGPEFCVWPEWKNLRYLLLEGTAVEQLLIDAIALMPRLIQLALLDPPRPWGYYSLTSTHPFEIRRIIELSKAGGSLQKIILGYTSLLEGFPQFFSSLRVEFSRSSLREGLDIQYVHFKSGGWTSPDSVSNGSFWESDGISILDANAALFDEQFAVA